MANRNRNNPQNIKPSMSEKPKVLKVDVDENNVVDLDLSPEVPATTDETKVVVNENELEKQKKKILARSQELEALLKDMDEDTVKAELEK